MLKIDSKLAFKTACVACVWGLEYHFSVYYVNNNVYNIIIKKKLGVTSISGRPKTRKMRPYPQNFLLLHP